MSKKPANGGGRLSALLLGGAAKKKPRRTVDRTVVHGKRYGFVVPDKRATRKTVNGETYRCTCDCGTQVYLTKHQLEDCARSGLGCLTLPCWRNDLEEKLRFNPEVGVRHQLEELLDTQPDMVDPAWGGTAYLGMPQVSRGDGVEAALKHLLPQVTHTAGEWLIWRRDDELPHAEGNSYLGLRPTVDRDLVIQYGEAKLTVDEVAETFDLEPTVVLKHIQQYGTGAELIEVLIEESIE